MVSNVMRMEEEETTVAAGPYGLRHRPRRLRSSPAMRELAAVTRVHASDLVMPHFVCDDPGLADERKQREGDLPALARVTPQEVVQQVSSDVDAGIRTHLLFGVVDHKDLKGSGAWNPDGPVPQALRLVREELGAKVNLLSDVCLCGYTDHGHCGVLSPDGFVDNDATLPLLSRVAVAHAQAGADMVCPSDMMDGRVASIRDALDQAGHKQTGILSYSSKFASVYYGPFRETAGSAPSTGDRRGYQLDPRNALEAVREALMDEQEGADAVMVKPALAYLDVMQSIKASVRVPVAAYHVSGEYALNRLGAARGLFDEREAVLEQLTAIKRAGADWIITYHARDAVEGGWLA